MKTKSVTIFSLFLAVFALVATDLHAARGRGGGGGGPRGGGGGGHAIQRSHNVQRSHAMPQSAPRPGNIQRAPQHSPSFAKPQGRPDISRPVPAVQGHKTPARSDVQQFFRDHPTKQAKPLIDKRPAQRPDIKPVDRTAFQKAKGGAGDVKSKFQSRDYQKIGDRVRGDVKKHHPHSDNWFRGDYWNVHNIYPPYYHYHRNWWAWATVGGITAWLAWDAHPYYYYGYYDDAVWVPTYEALPPAINYDVQVQTIEATTPDEEADWMPLGVFSIVVSGDDADAAPKGYVQLALSKDGSISGVYIDAEGNVTSEVQGLVDEESQRAAWKQVGKDDSEIIETGVFNLSQDEAPARIYYSDGSGKDILLIRMPQQE